jgi:hypothetical protein
MLAVFFVILGCVGLTLNWPVIQKGILEWLTTSPEMDILESALKGCPAFLRLDGKIILVLSATILVTAFIRTTRTLLNIRLVILAVISAIISAEIFTVLIHTYPFASYTGALYSVVFYFTALAAAVFRFGSVKSLNSTFMGKPMSESKALGQTFSSFLGHASSAAKVTFTAGDNITGGWDRGEDRDFDSHEIRIGREGNWANLVVGEEWPSVSNRHGVIRVIGKILVYEPLTGYYSFSIDGKPYSESKELPNQSVISLVSGHGPKLEVNYSSTSRSWFHPRTMGRVKEITIDEFKKLQLTFKIMVIVTLLALPLLWIFKGLQEKSLLDHMKREKTEKAEIKVKLEEKREETKKLHHDKEQDKTKIRRLKKDVHRLKEQNLQKDEELAGKKAELKKLRHQPFSEKDQKELEHDARIINIKFCSQRTSVYFPFVTCFEKGKSVVGAAFFARGQDGKVYLIVFKNLIFDSRKRRWGDSFFFIYRNTRDQFSSCRETLKDQGHLKESYRKRIAKFPSLYEVLYISGSEWGRKNIHIGVNGVVKMEMGSFPEYLINDVPVIDHRFSLSDRAAFFGCNEKEKFYTTGKIEAFDGSFINSHIDTKDGFPGGPLLKVAAGGRYSVIGIFWSGNRFVRF